MASDASIQGLQRSIDNLIESLAEQQSTPYRRATEEMNTRSGGFGAGTGFVGGVANAVSQGITEGSKMAASGLNAAYTSGLVQTQGYKPEEMFAITDALELMQKEGLSFKLLMGSIQVLAKQVTEQFYMESELRRKINEETGLTGELSEHVRDEIWDAYPGVLNLGYGIEQLSNYYSELIENTGKFTMLNSEALQRSAEISRAFVGDLDQMGEVIAEFERVGIGATTALEAIEDAGVQTLALGLRSKKVIEEVGDNIERLNQYGFEDGIQGLADMSRKATEFRMNLEDTFTIAEKVINPDSAVELSANLQVIGGAIGEFADPLKLMYMATNNVEGLQDALIGAADGLATYNSEQGKFEVSGANLRRARDMAEALGISLGDLTRTAVAAQERARAASDLLSTGLQMSDEDREFLTNLGTMKDGKMTIQIPESIADKINSPTEIALSEMTMGLKEELIKNRKDFEDMDSRDIAEEQVTLLTRIERNIGSMAAMARIEAANMIKESTPFTKMENVLEGANEQLFDAWSGGRFKQFVQGGFSFDSKEGENFRAEIENTFGEQSNKIVKKLQQLREGAEKEGAIAKSTDVNHRGTVTYNISSPNMLDDISRKMVQDPNLEIKKMNERDFTNSEHFW